MSSDSEGEREKLVQALQAHGQRFLEAFGEHAQAIKSLNGLTQHSDLQHTKGKRKLSDQSEDSDSKDSSSDEEDEEEEEEEEEWTGISTPKPPVSHTSPMEVDYSSKRVKGAPQQTKAQGKAFMVGPSYFRCSVSLLDVVVQNWQVKGRGLG